MSKMMKNVLKKLVRDEEGQAFILVLIFLLVGGLIIAPLLGFMSTGLKVGQMHETRMDELYAADAGVEDALYKIKTDYASFTGLGVNDSHSYTLTDPVNGETVDVTVTKLALIESIVDPSEYKEDQPHEDWITFDAPAEEERTATYVEYSCNLTFHYDGVGNRRIQQIGVFFAPVPSVLVEGPYEITYTPVISDTKLESIENTEVAGGFAFIWKWQHNKGPLFFTDDTGVLSFKFKVHDPEWAYSLYFVWALVKEQDISYVTNAPGSYQWLIEATAGDTEVVSPIASVAGSLDILAWEINPQ